jgi:G3E family GTPase
MATRKSVPILLLTGFLGGGKTSLLARWLRDPECADAVAIINELGEVGLDDRLTRTAIDTPLLLENGCACCAGADDLAGALEGLFWDRLHRRIPAYSRVIIETTGLADPRPILDLVASRAIVAERYHIEAVATVIDARLGPSQLAEFAECDAQLRSSDVIVISKADLASDDEIAATKTEVTRVKPGAPIFVSRGADVSAGELFAAIDNVTVANVHAGVQAAHTPGVTTAFADMPDAMDRAALEAALSSTLRAFGGRLLRVKGLVRLTPDAWSVVQVAPDHAIHFSSAPEIKSDARAGLTIIARDIPAGVIASRLQMSLGKAKGLAHAV